MGLMFVLSGIGGFLVGLGGYAFPAIRNVETIMPDFVAAAPPAAAERLLREKQMKELLEQRSRLMKSPDSPSRQTALLGISQSLRALGRQSAEEQET